MSVFSFMIHLRFIYLFILQKCFPQVKHDQLCDSARISASGTDVTRPRSKKKPSEIFQKVAVLRQSLTETEGGTKKDVKGVNKSSYRTSSSTPGTPKLPAVHVQTRSITAGGCSPESTRRTMSRRGTKATLSGCLTVLHSTSFMNFGPRCCSLTDARRTDGRVGSR